MNKINLIVLTFFLLVSCGTLKDAGKVLRNEKIKTTDEFLVKKKQPLVLPPDYNKIPEPGTMSNTVVTEKDKIKKILKVPKEGNILRNKSSSVENSILNKIRK